MFLDASQYRRIVTGQAPRINWSHPLARDLRAFALYGRVSSYSIEVLLPSKNVVHNTGNPNAYGNTSRSYSPKYGPGFNSAGGSSGFGVGYTTIPSNTKSTAVFIGKLRDSTTASYLTGVFNQFINGYIVSDSFNGVAGNVGLSALIGAGYINSPTTVTVDATDVHCIATSSAGTGASNTIKLFVDGVLKDTWSPGGNPVFAGTQVADATSGGSRHTYMQIIFARELSVVELLALQENPYQMFAQQTSPKVFLPVSFSYSRPIADLSNAGWVRVP